MTRPLSKPEWIPDNDTDKIIAPSSSKQSTGWLRDEKPPYQFWNWFWNLVSQWITHVEAISIILGLNEDNTEAADVTITGGNASNVQVYDSLIAQCDIENTPIGIEIPASVAATILSATEDPISDDGVGNRAYNDLRYDARYGVMRSSRLNILHGSVANSLCCQLVSQWRGDVISITDNISKDSTVGRFSLNATGTVLTIAAAAFTGNGVLAVLSADTIRNGAENNLNVYVGASANGDVFIEFNVSGTDTDITSILNAGEQLNTRIAYVSPS